MLRLRFERLEPVTHHQNGRVAQGAAVVQQLLERRVEVFAWGFVLSRKSSAFEDVGIAAHLAQDPCLKGLLFKQITVLATRLGHAQQIAQVNKVALRALFFVQVKRRTAGPPFGDEVLWGHGVLIAIRLPFGYRLVAVEGVVKC